MNRSNKSERVKCRVTEIILDDSFRPLIEYCGLENVMENVDSVEEAVSIYESFPHTDLDKIKTYKEAIRHYGVVAFKLELL